MGISDATTVYADDVISTDTVAAQVVKYIVEECPEEGCIYGLMNDMQVHYSSLRKPVIFFDRFRLLLVDCGQDFGLVSHHSLRYYCRNVVVCSCQSGRGSQSLSGLKHHMDELTIEVTWFCFSLQAVAKDEIFPGKAFAFFAKGYGAGSEPRRAYLLAFVIAVSCILIGEYWTLASLKVMSSLRRLCCCVQVS